MKKMWVALYVSISWSLGFPAQAQDAAPLLWEARSGDRTVYLFGTLHVGKPEFYPLPKPVDEAYRRSKFLILETDFSDTRGQAEALGIGSLPAGKSLFSELPVDLSNRLSRALEANTIPADAFRPIKPFMAMLALVMMEYAKLGYLPQHGLDQHFAVRAAAEAKPVIGLESMGEQMRMLDELSTPLQNAMLDLTLKDMESGAMAPLTRKLVDAWRRGDAEAVRALLETEEKRLPPALAAEFHEKFLTSRNRVMLAGIERALKSADRLFVAVGALHLIGTDSLLEMLGRKGFQIVRRE
ncbi:MAG: TraB/GumN family protein [Burkholderiales bacterium]